MSKFANMYETDPNTSEIHDKHITRMKTLMRMIYWFKSVSGLSKHKLRFSGEKKKRAEHIQIQDTELWVPNRTQQTLVNARLLKVMQHLHCANLLCMEVCSRTRRTPSHGCHSISTAQGKRREARNEFNDDSMTD